MSVRIKAAGAASHTPADVSAAVAALLARVERGGEAAALDIARELDAWQGEVRLGRDDMAAAAHQVPDALRADIAFAHDNVRRFAEAQKATLTDMTLDVLPGFVAGQRQIPVSAAGCYVPGGRYAHVASALMTAATARAAGVERVVAVSPPRGPGLPPAILHALHVAGADAALCLGGVPGVAAMAFGLFGLPECDVIVGPGNAYVAEAKRQLFGRVGIDMVAGPTDSMVLADATADPQTVAWDLIGQAEHGATSPVWLITDHRPLAEAVLALAPRLVETLPEPNRTAARAAWTDLGEIVLCRDRKEMAAEADRIAPEHLQVMAADLDWWLARLRAYGSLFLGAETTVAMGDKCAGPNHVLPTGGAARYTGGLSVHKFVKTVTWQRATPEGACPVAEAAARISRAEGMEGHARTADLRARPIRSTAG
ncbi:MAG: histidinol dehydrogenase [Shimia sp.]